jgi:hypothetical protein
MVWRVLIAVRLLPTNCVRACTAVPIEISFNSSVDPDKLYRAEIQFISRESFIQELRILLGDLGDGPSGNLISDSSGDSDAAIALRKLLALFPDLNRDLILEEGTNLADSECVRQALGTTVEIAAKKEKELYKQLQKFVDSKDKTHDASDKIARSVSEYWPLVKVVRIFTKAAALELGTVIVDLVSSLHWRDGAFANCTKSRASTTRMLLELLWHGTTYKNATTCG